jgi:hypothetical protein
MSNPYQSPQTATTSETRRPVMTWGQGIVIVVGTTVACGAGGLAISWALGTFVPDYYRSVFGGGNRPGFDPVAVGIGQGLSQGVMLGLLAGLVVVAAIAWFRSRRQRT